MNLLHKIIVSFKAMITPAILGFLIGLAVYTVVSGENGLLISFGVTILGLIIGLINAVIVWIRTDT